MENGIRFLLNKSFFCLDNGGLFRIRKTKKLKSFIITFVFICPFSCSAQCTKFKLAIKNPATNCLVDWYCTCDNTMTLKAFKQAIFKLVRKEGYTEDTTKYVVCFFLYDERKKSDNALTFLTDNDSDSQLRSLWSKKDVENITILVEIIEKEDCDTDYDIESKLRSALSIDTIYLSLKKLL